VELEGAPGDLGGDVGIAVAVAADPGAVAQEGGDVGRALVVIGLEGVGEVGMASQMGPARK